MLECAGFKVINLGIKVDLDKFMTAIKEGNVSAIGMSGTWLDPAHDMLRP